MKKTTAEIDASAGYPNKRDTVSPLSLGEQERKAVEQECDVMRDHENLWEYRRKKQKNGVPYGK